MHIALHDFAYGGYGPGVQLDQDVVVDWSAIMVPGCVCTLHVSYKLRKVVIGEMSAVR